MGYCAASYVLAVHTITITQVGIAPIVVIVTRCLVLIRLGVKEVMMAEMYGLESPPKTITNRCPLCGSDCVFYSEQDRHYSCSTVYYDGHLQQQGHTCKKNSFRVLQRVATIQGILDACDTVERNSVWGLLVKFMEAGVFKHK